MYEKHIPFVQSSKKKAKPKKENKTQKGKQELILKEQNASENK